ncbi:MAG TPA: VanZ family protein [Gemmatimonadaceae bacterium]|nr:VanZ family protein [Gemmatimonadaceae bacterium]
MSHRRWAPSLAWAAVILVITSIPGPVLAPVSPYSFPGADKLVHATLYGVLGWLVGRAAGVPATGRRIALLALVGIALFAALDEWHQHFILERSTELLDWLADSLGATCGLVAQAALRREQTT